MINNLLQFDQSFFYWFNNLQEQNSFIDFVVHILAEYTVYMIPIALLVCWFIYKTDKNRIDMLKATIASVLLWQIPTRIIAWIWYRPRPFTDLAGTKELFFHVPSYSFPSDHATFLAAISMYFYLMGYKKVGIIGFIITFLVSISRIISGLHYPGDIVGGWILGAGGAWIIYILLDKYIQKYIAKPILKLAKFIRLA